MKEILVTRLTRLVAMGGIVSCLGTSSSCTQEQRCEIAKFAADFIIPPAVFILNSLGFAVKDPATGQDATRPNFLFYNVRTKEFFSESVMPVQEVWASDAIQMTINVLNQYVKDCDKETVAGSSSDTGFYITVTDSTSQGAPKQVSHPEARNGFTPCLQPKQAESAVSTFRIGRTGKLHLYVRAEADVTKSVEELDEENNSSGSKMLWRSATPTPNTGSLYLDVKAPKGRSASDASIAASVGTTEESRQSSEILQAMKSPAYEHYCSRLINGNGTTTATVSSTTHH